MRVVVGGIARNYIVSAITIPSKEVDANLSVSGGSIARDCVSAGGIENDAGYGVAGDGVARNGIVAGRIEIYAVNVSVDGIARDSIAAGGT